MISIFKSVSGVLTALMPYPQPHPAILRLTLSIIVPVYNGGEKFRQCLSSLFQADPSPQEIIVVADGDTDGSWRVGEELGAKVVRMSKQGGPARARNEGARAAKGEILLFIDADVIVPPDMVSRIVRTFQGYPHLSALFGSYDDTPGETNFLSQYKNLFHYYIHQTSGEEASTFWGACGAIRRQVFMELGGFDESYRQPSIEDIELGYRLKGAGYRIRLDKGLQIRHLKRWTSLRLLKSDFFYRALPWAGLIWRNRRFINDLNLRGRYRLSVMMVWGFLIGMGWAFHRPESLAVAGFLALSLVLLNMPVYRFFARKRGFWFALKVIPWHWLYYFYCGLAFFLGFLRYFFLEHFFRKPDPPKALSRFPRTEHNREESP